MAAQSGGPLAGIKVADFCWAAAGPITTMYLASHGATVVRIESRTRPCVTRVSGPFKDNKPGIDRSGMFAFYNVNKLSIAVDLTSKRGMDVARRLVAWADVVTESFVPGTMERMGLGFEDLKKINPDIIMFRSSNQGQTGPHARHPGMGLQLVGLAGFTHLTGWPEGEPQQPWGAYTDMIAPRIGAAAIIAALQYRDRTGKGTVLDQSQYEGGVFFLSPQVLDYQVNGKVAERNGNRSETAAPHAVFRCQGDDRWCAIAALTEEQWSGLCNAIGQPGMNVDPRFATLEARKRNEPALNRRIEEWTITRTAEDVMRLLQEHGVPSALVCNGRDVLDNEQLRANGFFWKLPHPVLGEFSHLRPAFSLSATPGRPERPAPCLGEHTEYVCREILGMPEDEFAELLGEGAIEIGQCA